MNTLKLAVILAIIGASIVACTQDSVRTNTADPNIAKNAAPQASPTQSGSPTDVAAAGKDLYTANCQICHRDTGKGGKVTIKGKQIQPADLTAPKHAKHSDDDLLSDVLEGAPDDGMPAFRGKLKEDEIKEIIRYVRELQGHPGQSM